jgi:DNA-binding transcriptional LysR family regulator
MDRPTTMMTFTIVVASGSFTAAAQQLALVTRHVHGLENRLGARATLSK